MTSPIRGTAAMSKTMTLNLTDREMEVVEQYAAEFDLSKTSIMRQALRWYQLTNERLRAGEKVIFSGDEQRIAEFVGPGLQSWPPPSEEQP
jgi:hypothetical protein